MFSSNIIVRDQALADLINLNGPTGYYLMVAAVAFIAWRLAKWI